MYSAGLCFAREQFQSVFTDIIKLLILLLQNQFGVAPPSFGCIIKFIDKAIQNWILLKPIDKVIPLCSEHQRVCDSHMTLQKSKMANNNGLHRFHVYRGYWVPQPGQNLSVS